MAAHPFGALFQYTKNFHPQKLDNVTFAIGLLRYPIEKYIGRYRDKALDGPSIRGPRGEVFDADFLERIWHAVERVFIDSFGEQKRVALGHFISGIVTLFAPIDQYVMERFEGIDPSMIERCGFGPGNEPRDGRFLPEIQFFCQKAEIENPLLKHCRR